MGERLGAARAALITEKYYYVLGSAHAFTHFAGQIAARAGADTFVADYRLAPVTSNSTHEGSIIVDDEADVALLRRRRRLHVFDIAGKLSVVSRQ